MRKIVDANLPQGVSHAEWEAARARLLVKEKEATRVRGAGRRALQVADVRIGHTGNEGENP